MHHKNQDPTKDGCNLYIAMPFIGSWASYVSHLTSYGGLSLYKDVTDLN